MLLGLTLAIGAIGLGVAEILRLLSGTIGVLDGTIEVLAWTAIAVGIWGCKDHVGAARAGRVGIVLVSFAAMSFAMVMIITLTAGTLGALARGEIGYADIVFTPFYGLALVFLVAGLVGFAIHFARATDLARALAAGFAALALVHGARLFVASSLGYHTLANIALAIGLGALCAIVLPAFRTGPKAR